MKRSFGKLFNAIVLAVMLALAVPFVAFADNVVNDVTVNGTDTFTAPGSTTIGYKINANGGDGQNGCNASDGSPATVTLSVPAGVTASKTSLPFTACNVFQQVTFSSSTPGNYAVNVTSISDSGAGSYSNQANFTLHVNAPSDSTPPVLSLPANITEEATSAAGAVVNYSASATDNKDGAVNVTCSPASGSTFALGSTTVNCSAEDAAGNKASGSFTVKVQDTTTPKLTLPTDLTEEATSASGAKVIYSASASDVVDGAITPTCSPASGSTFPLGSTTVNCSAEDAAGNEASGSFIVKVQDTTAPSNITFNGAINDGNSFYYGEVPAQPTCSATDAVGLKSCTVTGYGTAVGSYTLTATAEDTSGNKATKTLGYTVKSWTFKGFYQPVDMNDMYNTVKGGSTVPFKFEVFAGSTEKTATSSDTIKSLTSKQVTCNAGAPVDDIELTATGATTLRYDAAAGQYVYNWQTPKGPVGSCYSVTISSADGSGATAYFKLK